MKVLVAVARKLLIAIWHVLHDETDYKGCKSCFFCQLKNAYELGKRLVGKCQEG